MVTKGTRSGLIRFVFLFFIFCANTLAADSGRTFTMRLAQEPETLDWNRAHTPIETYLLVNLMEGLVGFDSKLNTVPALAESWKISQDGKTYTFHLRKGVRWSDGVPLKARDFLFSWKRLLSPSTAAAYAYLLYDVVGAEEYGSGKITDFSKVGIFAPDDGTFVVKLKKPVAYWIMLPTFWVTFPLREDVVQKFPNNWDLPAHMVTVGAFTLESHEIENRIVMRANPLYWGSRGNVDRVVGLIVKDDSTAVSLYEAGMMDFVGDLGAINLSRLAGNPELKTFPYLKTAYLGFLSSTNLELRRAIAQAIDKTKIGPLLNGGQTPATSFVPPGLPAYSDQLGLRFDPTQAHRTGTQLHVILPSGEQSLTLMQFIQAQLKVNLGIDLVLEPFDNKTFRSQLDLGVFPMFLLSWSADYPDPDNFLSLWLSESGNNRARWKNSDYDKLVIASRYLRNLKVREKNYIAAQKILLEQSAVIIPLYYEPIMALVKKRPKKIIESLELNPLNYLILKNIHIAGQS